MKNDKTQVVEIQEKIQNIYPASRLRVFSQTVGKTTEIGIPSISIDSVVAEERNILMSDLETCCRVYGNLLEFLRVVVSFDSLPYIKEQEGRRLLMESPGLVLIRMW